MTQDASLHGASQEAALPDAWCETISPEGEPVLVPNPARRRRKARLLAITAVVAGSIGGGVFAMAKMSEESWSFASFMVLSALFLGSVALWLARTRPEWVISPGRLRLQRRNGRERTRRFEAVALEIMSSQGEGVRGYHLRALDEKAVVATAEKRVDYRPPRILQSTMEDLAPIERFGQWLSQRCDIPLTIRDPIILRAKAERSL